MIMCALGGGSSKERAENLRKNKILQLLHITSKETPNKTLHYVATTSNFTTMYIAECIVYVFVDKDNQPKWV